MAESVIEYVMRRLKEIGVGDVFGVAGDYAFPVNDAIAEDPAINWIGCCNELNAGYAADGYARMRGVGAVCTTYGVGELAAMSAIAGSYAEHLAVFHLVGAPNLPTQEGRALVHHTLGTGEFDLFARMAEPIVCASAIMTPQNAASETERLVAGALYHRRPVARRRPQHSRASRRRRLHRSDHRCLRGPTDVQEAARERQIVLQRAVEPASLGLAGVRDHRSIHWTHRRISGLMATCCPARMTGRIARWRAHSRSSVS